MSKYIHDFDLVFTVHSNKADPDDLTNAEILEGLNNRIHDVAADGWQEICECLDTFCED